MVDLPEVTDSTKRKLELQWLCARDTNRLTGEHLDWHTRERNRIARVAAQMGPGIGGSPSLNEWSVDKIGIGASISLAVE